MRQKLTLGLSLGIAWPLLCIPATHAHEPNPANSGRAAPSEAGGPTLLLSLDLELGSFSGVTPGEPASNEVAVSVDRTPPAPENPPPNRAPSAPARPLRLSDWLLSRPPSQNAYPLGLSWRVPEEEPPQKELQLQLVSALSGEDKTMRAAPDAMARMREWIAALPVTGRVPVPAADGRWLQMNAARDPVLRPGYTVVLPDRPRTVTVVTASGALCHIVHRAGYEAKSYLDACGVKDIDVVWIAQADGRVQRYGVALWNREAQDEPAPGAWLWAPPRHGGWNEKFSERLIRFLATQGPAPDPDGARTVEATALTSAPTTAATSYGSRSQPVDPSSTGFAPRAPAHVEPASLPDTVPMRSRELEVTSSDWGSTGLLQTPTARMRDTGHFNVHFSYARPYLHGNLFWQPVEWLEAGFRYTDIGDVPYGGLGSVNPQSNKDKSIDVKLRVWPESAYVPHVAVGLRDIGGTGLYGGEYVVANKRTADFDWSLGFGWGYIGARGNVRNPLSRIFGDAFDRRSGETGQGGELALKSFFRGPGAFFGGVQYQTPWAPFLLKAEYEGNNYSHEPFRRRTQDSPINFGVVYRATRLVDLSVGYERGNTVMFGITINTSLPRLTQPKLLDPPPVPVVSRRPTQVPDWSKTTADLGRQTDWQIGKVEQGEHEVRVVVEEPAAVYWRRRVDRAAGVLHRDAPASVDRFAITYRQRGIDVAEHVIDRDAWVAERTQYLAPREQRESVIARAPESGSQDLTSVQENTPRRFTFGVAPSYSHILGGPDAFVLYQLGAQARATLNLRPNTWIQTALNLRVLDNFDQYQYRGESKLPRVRTLLREYNVTSRLTMPYAQLTHVGKAGNNQYYSVYGGYLEQMFAGVGAEWLYRPFASSLAFGVDVNAVRQRDFDQHFGFRDYRVATGHASLYWDTGWNDVLVTLQAGRYLAGDMGATLSVARAFRNGVLIGAFATKTNVSAAEFGEGSFDKGVYMSIPFDAFFTRSSSSYANLLWKPLTRDGGAMLWRQNALFALTGTRSPRTLEWAPAAAPADSLTPADRADDWKPSNSGAKPYTQVTPKAPALEWEQPGSGANKQHRLVQALYAQGFRNVKVDYDPTQRVIVSASHEGLRPVSVAVGRAARTALLQAPVEARGIEMTLLHGADPQARYEFFDLPRLQLYLDGALKAEELRPYVKVTWLNPAAAERDPIVRVDDLATESKPSVLGALVPDTLSVSRVANDYAGAAKAATRVDWVRAGALGAGMVLSSSLLDNRAHRFAQDHASSKWLTNGVRVADAIPWLAIGGAGLAAIDGSDPRRSRTGYSALEAGATALVVSQGLKYGVGRARPNTGFANTRFEPGSRSDAFWSFPSGHSIVAWSVLTPFALEYDAPWLYGIAAAANLGRIGSREHWVSDTVASSLLGYGLGRLFWQSGRDQGKGEPRVFFDGHGLSMHWDWK